MGPCRATPNSTPEKVLLCPPSITLSRQLWALAPHRWGPSQPGVQALSLRAARQGCLGGHSHLPLASPWRLAANRGTAPPRPADQGPTLAPFLTLPGEDPRKHGPAPTAPSSGAAKVGPASQGRFLGTFVAARPSGVPAFQAHWHLACKSPGHTWVSGQGPLRGSRGWPVSDAGLCLPKSDGWDPGSHPAT